jgi:DNA-binding XRE family transcriptional regulator
VAQLHNVAAMTIEELKRARARLGMTQGELAEALGMQKNSITRMEMGIQRIMTTTELSIRYLLLTMRKPKREK